MSSLIIIYNSNDEIKENKSISVLGINQLQFFSEYGKMQGKLKFTE